MLSFEGFSEEDINKLKNGQVSKTINRDKQVEIKHKNFAPAKKSVGKSKNTILNNKTVVSNHLEEIPEQAKLHKIQEKQENVEKAQNNIERCDISSKTELPQNAEKKFGDLTEFQARQKLIEEQNRKRKELLAKALADRTKQTKEEAERLNEIQTQFKKLDLTLSNDVKILRKQIELASLDYTEAQKRYNKIEREFLNAKLHLHEKLEKKEMLTEHLCAIIEKNEERKAEKLNELLRQLEVDPTRENIDEKLSINGIQNSDISTSGSVESPK